MAPKIQPEWLNSQNVKTLLKALDAQNKDVYFVGGCVRDALLNLDCQDLDIGVPYPPEETLNLLQEHDIRAVATGFNHGTITAIIEGQHFEITSYRKDVFADGRHAEVEYTDNWQDDAHRRDLTINALYMDYEGQIYDVVGGLHDLEQGIVKFIGDPYDRIHEDFLRILRFFRFYGRLGAKPAEQNILSAIKISTANLSKLSKERVRDEFFKILKIDHPYATLKLMDQCHIFEELGWKEVCFKLFNELVELDGDFQSPFLRFLALMKGSQCIPSVILEKFHFTNDEIKLIITSVAEIYYQDPLVEVGFWQKERYLKGDSLFYTLYILSWAKGGHHISWQSTYNKIQSLPHPELPIGGRDIQLLGITDGPKIGEILKTVVSAWLDSGCELSAEECIEVAKQNLD